MFELTTMNFLTQPKVVVAVDIFRALQTAAASLKNNLMIFAGVVAVASIVIGGLFFLFGQRGAENGKMHVGCVLMGVGVTLGATSIITSLFGLFGQAPQGL